MLYSCFCSSTIPFQHFLRARLPLFPRLSVAGYVVKTLNGSSLCGELPLKFSPMDCTSVYKEKILKGIRTHRQKYYFRPLVSVHGLCPDWSAHEAECPKIHTACSLKLEIHWADLIGKSAGCPQFLKLLFIWVEKSTLRSITSIPSTDMSNMRPTVQKSAYKRVGLPRIIGMPIASILMDTAVRFVPAWFFEVNRTPCPQAMRREKTGRVLCS